MKKKLLEISEKIDIIINDNINFRRNAQKDKSKIQTLEATNQALQKEIMLLKQSSVNSINLINDFKDASDLVASMDVNIKSYLNESRDIDLKEDNDIDNPLEENEKFKSSKLDSNIEFQEAVM